jgi:hypothetical protein
VAITPTELFSVSALIPSFPRILPFGNESVICQHPSLLVPLAQFLHGAGLPMKNLGAGNRSGWGARRERVLRMTGQGLRGQANRLVLGLGAVLLFSQASVYAGDGSAAASPSPSPSPSPAGYEPFIPGLIDAFSQALTSPAYTPPQPGSTPTPRRGYAAPFDSPPFFTSDYQIGGTQLIGDPGEATVWPLMKAIYGSGTFGQWLKDNRINL